MESGEGIESYRSGMVAKSVHRVWNPVKELKAQGAFKGHGARFRYVESGEGIESIWRRIFQSGILFLRQVESGEGIERRESLKSRRK